jgi:hypothetical protein
MRILLKQAKRISCETDGLQEVMNQINQRIHSDLAPALQEARWLDACNLIENICSDLNRISNIKANEFAMPETARSGGSRPAVTIDCDQLLRLIATTRTGGSRPGCGRM